MSFIPVPLFPDFSLPSSVMVTVFLGVWILCLFNLRLGWPLSGLVVPGFVAPILLVQPHSALFILCEGVFTYLVARSVAGLLDRSGAAAPFFGRDRFFLIVVIGVFVRLVGDAVLLPLAEGLARGDTATLASLLGALFSRAPEQGAMARLGLGSFGLVVSALFANQLWKPGIVRGAVPSLVVLGLTYLATRFLLVPFTNFNPGRLAFLYNEVGSRLADSPKAYIILLSTALLASRLNLLFGWEFSGIMVPSLLALAWFEPLTIVVSLLEAFAILTVATGLLKLPVFRDRSMEGARKVLFFFTVSFALKVALAWAFHFAAPQEQPSDFFGFGFLLSTLIAIKAHDKHIFVRMVGTTLQASAAGLVLGLVSSTLLAEVREASLARGFEAFASRSGDAAMPIPAEVMARKRLEGPAPARSALLSPSEPTVFASLHRVFVESEGALAPAASGVFQPVDEAWLAAFSEQVVGPFVQAIASLERGETDTGAFRREIESVALRAEPFCYAVTLIPRAPDPRLSANLGVGASAASPASLGDGVALLSERSGVPCRRYQAALAVRWSALAGPGGEPPVEPSLLAVPHPIADPLVLEASLSAFERLSARAFVLAGAHPQASERGLSDVLAPAGRVSVYRLAQEDLLREFAQRRGEPMRVLEMRATQETSTAVRVAAPFGGEAVLGSLAPWSRGARLTFVGNAREAALSHNRSLELLTESLGARAMGTVWLSRPWRELFAFRGNADSLESLHFRSLGIPTRRVALVDILRESGVQAGANDVPERLRELHRGYLANGEVSQLDAMRRDPAVARVERIVDSRSRMTFLVFHGKGDRVLWVANLGSTAPTSIHTLKGTLEITESNVDAFAFARLGWLEFSS